MNERFCRVEQLAGREAFERLRGARVAVFGLGAVGSYAVEALARSGIGTLVVVDCDIVRPSNINRQLYALGSTIDHPKVEVARARILDINPDCRVDAHQTFAARDTLPGLLTPPLDAVIDAIDSVSPKVDLIEAAWRAGFNVISSMGATTRTDPALIRVGDIAETDVCPLARFVRKRLRRRGILSGIRCIYSVEEPRNQSPLPGGVEQFSRGRPRTAIGSLSYMTGIFGLIAAGEAIRLIARLNHANPPPGRSPKPKGKPNEDRCHQDRHTGHT